MTPESEPINVEKLRDFNTIKIGERFILHSEITVANNHLLIKAGVEFCRVEPNEDELDPMPGQESIVIESEEIRLIVLSIDKHNIKNGIDIQRI